VSSGKRPHSLSSVVRNARIHRAAGDQVGRDKFKLMYSTQAAALGRPDLNPHAPHGSTRDNIVPPFGHFTHIESPRRTGALTCDPSHFVP
jgi:hypothetical protein